MCRAKKRDKGQIPNKKILIKQNTLKKERRKYEKICIINVYGSFHNFLRCFCFAADTNGVAFKTEDINCDKGRIFKVDVKAKSSEKISAVLLKFTYDRNIIEYRSISTDSDSLAYAYDNGSTLNVSYLCKDGKNIDNDTVILNLEFKATAEGQSNLQYTAYDCVNSSAESVEISQCSSGKVSVTKQGSEKSNDNEKSDTTEYKSESNESTGNSEKSSIDELGSLNGKFSDNTVFMLIVGVICGLAVGVLCFVLYLSVIKRKNKAKEEKDRH